MRKKIKNIFISGPITPGIIAESIAHHSVKTNIGAHSIFLGQVRSDDKGMGTTTAIEYTAYESMALEKAAAIREEIFAKYPLTCMHIHHSLGAVKVGEICLFVFTSSEHRKVAINACSELVERIKHELPIWGNEIISENKTIWKENT